MRVVCFDLDDTLFKEITFLESAFWEIAVWAASHKEASSDSLVRRGYEEMLVAYHQGRNAFEQLNVSLEIHIPIQDYLSLYRSHQPQLQLSKETVCVLHFFKEQRDRLGLITDGRSLQQRNKIKALGLQAFIEEKDWIISEEFGSEKPALVNFEYFMKLYPEAQEYVYIGDNPKKDFIAPNRLGWTTIGLLDDGRNIHRQTVSYSSENSPTYWITEIQEVIPIFL